MARVTFGLALVVMVVASISASSPCIVALEGNVKSLQKLLVKIERSELNPLTYKIIGDLEACSTRAYTNDPKVMECRMKKGNLINDIIRNGPNPRVPGGDDFSVQWRMKELISDIGYLITIC